MYTYRLTIIIYIYIYIYTRSQARAKARAFVLAVLRMVGLERRKSFNWGWRGGVLRQSANASQIRCRKVRFSMPKSSNKGTQNNGNGSKKGPRNLQRHRCGTRSNKYRERVSKVWKREGDTIMILDHILIKIYNNLSKMPSPKTLKKQSREYMNKYIKATPKRNREIIDFFNFVAQG